MKGAFQFSRNVGVEGATLHEARVDECQNLGTNNHGIAREELHDLAEVPQRKGGQRLGSSGRELNVENSGLQRIAGDGKPRGFDVCRER
jgi:hypothetical protein